MGGGIVFLVGVFTLSKRMNKNEYWKKLIKPLLILAWLSTQNVSVWRLQVSAVFPTLARYRKREAHTSNTCCYEVYKVATNILNSRIKIVNL